jgi:hypothetical protein
MENKYMAKPKCPSCGRAGLENIVSIDSASKSRGGDAWFNVMLVINVVCLKLIIKGFLPPEEV